ncbi:MAG: helix-turn-helix domain-containing protein [Bacteroidetes bacterium]|nr:helix-turn-helix domain-containing protein [Bacteroidota bacterium]
MDSKEVCRRFRAIREIRRIKQSEIAAHLGISQSSYAKMENGNTRLSLERFLQIVNFLDTDPAFYFQDFEPAQLSSKSPYVQAEDTSKALEEPSYFKLYIAAKSSNPKPNSPNQKSA